MLIRCCGGSEQRRGRANNGTGTTSGTPIRQLFVPPAPSQVAAPPPPSPDREKTEIELRLQERVYALAAKLGPFEVMREALVDIRDSTDWEHWTGNKDGWDGVERFKTADEVAKVSGVHISLPKQVGRDKIQPCARLIKRLYLSDSNLSGPFPWTAIKELNGLELLDMSSNNFASGEIPQDLCRYLPRLQKLWLKKCRLSGTVPQLAVLKELDQLSIADNPQLGGRLSKALLARCSRVEYANCKREADAEGPALWGPLLLGASVAEGELSQVLCTCGADMSTSQLVDAPPPERARGAADKGRGGGGGAEQWEWVPWQRVWLYGLKRLRSKGNMLCVFPTAAFRAQYDDWENYDSDERCAARSFDPGLELEGERASTPLDWQRRHLLKAATKKRMEIAFIVPDGYRCAERVPPPPPTSWYPGWPDGTYSGKRGAKRVPSPLPPEEDEDEDEVL